MELGNSFYMNTCNYTITDKLKNVYIFFFLVELYT